MTGWKRQLTLYISTATKDIVIFWQTGGTWQASVFLQLIRTIHVISWSFDERWVAAAVANESCTKKLHSWAFKRWISRHKIITRRRYIRIALKHWTTSCYWTWFLMYGVQDFIEPKKELNSLRKRIIVWQNRNYDYICITSCGPSISFSSPLISISTATSNL